ncbi:MAG: cation diffusion facilitator family transporter [bacterium]|nr:cation diffusion facilitator family transporter [bacterium]
MSESHENSHGHNHGHAHSHGHHHHGHHHHGGDQSVRNLSIAFALNFLFTIAEIIGGLWTNSVAILADALHDLGDSLSLALALVMHRLSQRGRDETFSYGYRRFSLLAALINSLVLVVGSIYIFSEAIPRLLNPEPVYVPGMLGFAVAGILFNGLAAWKLHGGESLNEKMVRWHLLEDVLGWVAVLIASIVMLFWDLPILDPILSIGINLFILFNVSRILWDTVKVFLQSVPGSLSVEGIETEIQKDAGVVSVHDTHMWSLDGAYNVLTTHIVVRQASTLQDVHETKCRVRALLKQNAGISHATIEVEREDDDCGFADC